MCERRQLFYLWSIRRRQRYLEACCLRFQCTQALIIGFKHLTAISLYIVSMNGKVPCVRIIRTFCGNFGRVNLQGVQIDVVPFVYWVASTRTVPLWLAWSIVMKPKSFAVSGSSYRLLNIPLQAENDISIVPSRVMAINREFISCNWECSVVLVISF